MAALDAKYAWSIVALVLAALAVPWFLWGSSSVVAGLPVWVWWHIGWMVLTAGVFYVFARTAWGLGVESRGEVDG
ncbi:MAG: DUF3311 domain-containing protein [Haloarculaceae archaeon]